MAVSIPSPFSTPTSPSPLLPFSSDSIDDTTLIEKIFSLSDEEVLEIISNAYAEEGKEKVLNIFIEVLVDDDKERISQKNRVMTILCRSPLALQVGLFFLENNPENFVSLFVTAPTTFPPLIFDKVYQKHKNRWQEVLFEALWKVSCLYTDLKDKSLFCSYIIKTYPPNFIGDWILHQDPNYLGKLVSYCKFPTFTCGSIATFFNKVDWSKRQDFLEGLVEGWDHETTAVPEGLAMLLISSNVGEWLTKEIGPNFSTLSFETQKVFIHGFKPQVRDQFLQILSPLELAKLDKNVRVELLKYYSSNGDLLANVLGQLISVAENLKSKLKYCREIFDLFRKDPITVKQFLAKLAHYPGCLTYFWIALPLDWMPNVKGLPIDKPADLSDEQFEMLSLDQKLTLRRQFLSFIFDSAEFNLVNTDREMLFKEISKERIRRFCNEFTLPHDGLTLSDLARYGMDALTHTEDSEPLAFGFGDVLKTIPTFLISIGCRSQDLGEELGILLRFFDTRQIRAYACAMDNTEYVLSEIENYTSNMFDSDFIAFLEELPQPILYLYLKSMSQKFEGPCKELQNKQIAFAKDVERLQNVSQNEYQKTHEEVTNTAYALSAFIKQHYYYLIRALHRFVQTQATNLISQPTQKIPSELEVINAKLNAWLEADQSLHSQEKGWIHYLHFYRPRAPVIETNLSFDQGVLSNISKNKVRSLGIKSIQDLRIFGICSVDDLTILGLSENNDNNYPLLEKYLKQSNQFRMTWKLLNKLSMHSVSKMVEYDIVKAEDLFQLEKVEAIKPYLEQAKRAIEKEEGEKKKEAMEREAKRARNDGQ